MRLLMFIAVILFAIALICTLVPTVVLGAGWAAWLTGGLLVWAIDLALGGPVAPTVLRR